MGNPGRRGPDDVTALLREMSAGDRAAMDALVPLIYGDLRAIAQRHLVKEDPGHTLNATALVHESYLRLVDVRHVEWKDRAHFFALASRTMRRVLVDYARMRKRVKRGGGRVPVPLEEVDVPVHANLDEFLSLDEALTRLEAHHERACRVVEHRFFAGLTVEETAEVLGVSVGTVKLDWRLARAWLNRELATDP